MRNWALTDEFKEELRNYLIELLNVKTSVYVNTISLDNDMAYQEAINMLSVPITFGEKIIQFIMEDGVFVKPIVKGCLYTISIAS